MVLLVPPAVAPPRLSSPAAATLLDPYAISVGATTVISEGPPSAGKEYLTSADTLVASSQRTPVGVRAMRMVLLVPPAVAPPRLSSPAAATLLDPYAISVGATTVISEGPPSAGKE